MLLTQKSINCYQKILTACRIGQKMAIHFNANQCKVLHYGNTNLKNSYNLNNVHINAS